MRIAFNVAIDVADEHAAVVDQALDDTVRGLRDLDGVTQVDGTISNDQGRARATHEIPLKRPKAAAEPQAPGKQADKAAGKD